MTAVTISLAILLAVPLVAFALVFATGAACGVAAYHLSRTVVVQYQPLRKAVDQEKERNRAIAVAAKLGKEANDIALSHLSGLQLTREQFIADRNGE